MLLDQRAIQQLRQLEESFWIAETRFDLNYMERILSPDFFEFGCSGRIYRRADTLAIPAGAIQITLPLKDFTARPLAPDVVQVTYVSEVVYNQTAQERVQRCNRSSIWVQTDAGWQLRFHQGTPVQRG